MILCFDVNHWKECLAAVGIIVAPVVLFKLSLGLVHFTKTVVCMIFSRGIDFTSLGKWAVVTGSTDGIGKAYAVELAKRGMNIILISRNPEKLKKVATEIETDHHVETKIIPADFADGAEIFPNIREELSGLEIGVLVNNVGMFYDYPEYFADVSTDQMTRIVLPDMEQRKRGAIINVSSGLSFNPTPLATMYSSTKAYVNYFSKALNIEYKKKGIIVQTLIPFVVATHMSGITSPTLFMPSPTAFARSAVRTVGVLDVTNGYLPHTIQSYVLSMIPEFIYTKIMMTALLAARAKAMDKLKIA